MARSESRDEPTTMTRGLTLEPRCDAGTLVRLTAPGAVLVESAWRRRATRAYGALVRGAEGGGSLQQVLDQHIRQVREVSSRLDDMHTMTEYLEKRTRGSLQHFGLVRFNPFEDTGS